MKNTNFAETLSSDFYARPTISVAVDLLSNILVHQTSKGAVAGEIVEVEAYLGEKDPACHAFYGKTKRTKVFWENPGTVYVFVNYGIHFCLNAITRTSQAVGCVLIRALEPTVGIHVMEENRKTNGHLALTNGPAKLTQALGITLAHNGANFTQGSLRILGNEEPPNIVVTSRVGITKAKEEPLRFYKDGCPFVTPQNKLPRFFAGTQEMVKNAFRDGTLRVSIADTN